MDITYRLKYVVVYVRFVHGRHPGRHATVNKYV